MSEELSERFGLVPWTDLDWDVGGEGLVGVSLRAEPELQRSILAVLIARKLGNKSIDYTQKKYTLDFDGHLDRDKLIKSIVAQHSRAYEQFYTSIPVRSNERIGIFAFDLAIIRCRTTLDLVFFSARRGMLVESCQLARAMIEQFAYAKTVWPASTDEEIFGAQPQTKIGSLKQVQPTAPRAYGMLSRLAHYHPEEHYQFIGNNASVIQRSWKFKISALAWLIFILDVKLRLFKWAYQSNDHFPSSEVAKLPSCLESFDNTFDGAEFPAIDVVRSLLAIDETA